MCGGTSAGVEHPVLMPMPWGEDRRLVTDRTMQAAIAELPDRQRMAIILSAQQDKSNAEIAEILGSSEGAVEQLIVRARKKLRDQYRRLE